MTLEYIKYFDGCDRILDIGCGIGDFIELDKERIIGIDISEQALNICRKKSLNVKKGSATKIPFPDESFDGAYCSHVIEHLTPSDAVAMFYEVSRVLKNNGVFVLRTPVFNKDFYHHIGHIKPYPPSAVEGLLKPESMLMQFNRPPLKLEKVIYDFKFPDFVYKIWQPHKKRVRASVTGKEDSQRKNSASTLFSRAVELSHLLARFGVMRSGYGMILKKTIC